MAPTLTTFINSFQDRIEEPVRVHLKNVYACVALSMISASVGAYVDMLNTFLSDNLFVLVAGIGFLCSLHWIKDSQKYRTARMSMLLGFSFCLGLSLGPVIEQVIQINPSIIITSLFATSVVFVCFSCAALLANRGSWLYLGGTISSILFTLSIFSLSSLFFRSSMMFEIHLYIGLALMCAFVLYDTQLIMEKRRMGDKDFIAHSVDLFIDFIGIFRRILVILAQKEKTKEKKR